jgi:hypothetical protein
MKIAVAFPTLLHIEIQPVTVHNLKLSLPSIKTREFLSFIFELPDVIIERGYR